MYHLFEMHESDGNDNHITDVIVIAGSKDAAFDVIAANVKPPYEDSGLGDGDSVIYEHWKYYDDDGNPIDDDDIPEDTEGVCYSSTFYYQSSYDDWKEAEDECARYHGGPMYIGKEDNDNALLDDLDFFMPVDADTVGANG